MNRYNIHSDNVRITPVAIYSRELPQIQSELVILKISLGACPQPLPPNNGILHMLAMLSKLF